LNIEKTVENGDVRWQITNDDGSQVNATWLWKSRRLFIYTWGPRGGSRASLSLPFEMLKELAEEVRHGNPDPKELRPAVDPLECDLRQQCVGGD
jgi:hypothetical protein